jgi:hypothetical protein|tara:strand:- start:93 stop:467 length:375 start_codon:yes stop_codon:yes gene_type:complete
MAVLKEKLLYFASGGGADAAADNIVVPANSIIGINATAATTCNVYFKNPRILEGTDGDSTKNYVELTYTSGSYKAVCASIAKAIADAYGDAMVVVADDDNSVYVDSAISACIISTADADTNPDN